MQITTLNTVNYAKIVRYYKLNTYKKASYMVKAAM